MHDETVDSLERTSAAHLPVAHGGKLVDLYVGPERRGEIKTESRGLPSWDLTPRQLCDLELLLNGGFSPLGGFMTKADYERVCSEMRLGSGILWPIPITLDVSEDFAKSLTAATTANHWMRRTSHAARGNHPTRHDSRSGRSIR